MNLKKTIVSLMAAGVVLVGGLGGAIAQDASDLTDDQKLNISVTNDGVFNVQFCEGDGAFDKLDLDSETFKESDRTRTTDLVVCYTDTKADRGEYRTSLSATDFEAEGGKTIDASNLKMKDLSIMNSGQWGTGVGAISALDGAGGSLQRSEGNPSGEGEWGGGDFGEVSLHVHNIWAGAGTAGQKYQTDPGSYGPFEPNLYSDNGSWQEIELELVVPVTTVSGDYESTHTINVAPPVN